MEIITDKEEKDREERAKEDCFLFSRAWGRWCRHAYENIQKVKGVLEDSGLRCVICQTEFEIIGP